MTSKKRTQYHHGNLRAALLENAAEMIAEGGVESVTMRALSRRIGVFRTAPYRHFANKAALLAGVAEEGFKRLQQCLQAVKEHEEEDILAGFREMGMAYVQFAVENPSHYRLMFSRETSNFEAYPDLAATAKVVFDTLMTTIERGQAANKIKSGDSRALAYAAWATVHGLSWLWIDGQISDLTDLKELTNVATHTLIEGMIHKGT
jgi:AcrR family transcriptional regulator